MSPARPGGHAARRGRPDGPLLPVLSAAPATGTILAGDTVAGALAARYPYLTPDQCGLLEAVLLSGLTSAAGRDCALAVIRPQPGGFLDISVLIGSATGP